MRLTVLKTLLAAGALAFGSAGALAASTAAAPATATNAAEPVPATAPAPGTSMPSVANSNNPATAAAPTTAAPADPTLAQDGAPALAPTEHIGQPTDGWMGIQKQVTANGERALWFHNVVLFPLITLISIFVLVLLVWTIIRYRASANPTPSRTSHNTFIEVVWTLVPVLILVAIAVPSIRLLAAQFKPAPKGAVTLKATGNQWYWTYEYPDHGGIQLTANMLKEQSEVPAGQRYRTDRDGPRLLATDQRVVLPVGVPIRLITTAADVIHSWAVPAFWIKLDAVPGRINETSFTIEKPGLYFGQCSELCGARHAYMPIAVEAVPPAQFAAWVRAKGGAMPGAAAPSAAGAPQPGSDAKPEATAPTGGPVVNATEAAPVTNQRATANDGGLGSTEQ
jgi:cytochrome c oxidase subunit 2